jgi:beta-1,4-mannosyl-glycoprotein beta-1,4-N-acetylglucosaminyltransferase
MLSPAVRRKHFSRRIFAALPDEAFVPAPDTEDEPGASLESVRRSGEFDAYLELADWQRRHGLLGSKAASLMARQLSEFGRHAEALPVLLDPRYAGSDRPHYWRALAAAYAGTDQLGRAGEALRRAEALDGGEQPSASAFATALRLVQEHDASGGAPPGSWTEAASLVEACLVLDLYRRAVDVLADALRSSSPQTEDEVLDACHIAQTILRLADPGLAREAMSELQPQFDRCELLRAPPLPRNEADDGEAGSHPAVSLCRALALSKDGRSEAAASVLAPLAAHPKDREPPGAEDARIELAGTVGDIVLKEVQPRLAAGCRRKVIDMFPINDELLMLKIKLEEMHSWVDHFIVVESLFTFRGDRKPLHFDRAKADFSRFSDKIVHVVVDTLPPWASTTWTREFHQRDCGLRGLSGLCGPDDLVLVTDVDEIIDGRIVERLDGPFASLAMPTYGYFFNLQRVERRQARWAAVLKARYLQRIGPSYAKIGLPQYAKGFCLEDAGWHFSNVRDVDGLITKFTSYSNIHSTEVSRTQLEQNISDIRTSGRAQGYVRREIDESFPRFIRENAAELSQLIL